MKAKLDQNISHLNGMILEIFDGYMLSEGHLERVSNRTARFNINQKHKEFCEYIATFFAEYFEGKKVEPKYRRHNDDRTKQGYTETWRTRTLGHPDLLYQYNRWYPEGIKIVPSNVLITPLSVLVWYLGDGNLDKSGRGRPRASFATMSFSKENIQTNLMPKLNTIIANNDWRLHSNCNLKMTKDGTEKLFKYIGHTSPVRCYDYKFLSINEVDVNREMVIKNNARTRFSKLMNYEGIENLHAKCLSVQEISDELGYKYQGVWQALKNMNLTPHRVDRSIVAKKGWIKRQK